MDIDPINDVLSRKLGDLADTRQSSLGDTSELQIMTRVMLEHETLRIESRFGQNHPRTRHLRARLDNAKSQIDSIVAEREKSEIQIPQVNTHNALLHGIVADRDRRGVPGLMVCLTGENGRPVRDLDEPITDASGYFAFDLSPESLKLLQSKHPDGVFVSVFSGNGENLIHRQPKPLVLRPKDRVYLNIGVDRIEVLDLDPGESPVDPEMAIVPDVVGRDESTAVKILKEAGLQAGESQSQPVPDAERVGLVLSQEPQPGTAVLVASNVNLVIGTALLRVPQLVGLSLKDANEKLKGVDLKLGAQSNQPVDDDDQAGLIIAQSPDAGKAVDQGSVVDVVVGISSSVKVPELIGIKSASARRKLRAAGLEQGTVTKRVAEEPDVVLEQKPAAGVEVSLGSAVDLVVSEQRREEG